jgi:thioredoxin 1
MKTERVTSWYKIALLVVILIAIVAVYAIGNGNEKGTVDLVVDTVAVGDDSITGNQNQTESATSEHVSVKTVPSETLSDQNAEDTIHIAAANPLEKALKKGLPVVADFGRSTCVPCKMMLPILERLEHDLEGKASILVIDIREYSALSRKYKISLIPTQVFFDSSGEEVFRHHGFMPEEEIINQLKKMGMD